jgi:hypothetical protein
MTTSTSLSLATLLRNAVQQAHDLLEATMADVTPEQAHWTPPGIANPLGATYAHVLISEDMIVNGMFRQQAPLFASSHAGKTGLSEPMPQPGPDWVNYGPWTRRVQIDLSMLREYGRGVFAATDAFLSSLSEADLARELDLTGIGFGKPPLALAIMTLVANHVGTETGEISCLKGLQGARGYPR